MVYLKFNLEQTTMTPLKKINRTDTVSLNQLKPASVDDWNSEEIVTHPETKATYPYTPSLGVTYNRA